MSQSKNEITQILKRDGRIAKFDREKIVNAIFKAAQAVGGHDRKLASKLTDKVLKAIGKRFHHRTIPSVEDIQDVVEKVLIEEGHAKTAKSYILYRQQHNRMRDLEKLISAEDLVGKYLEKLDWKVK